MMQHQRRLEISIPGSMDDQISRLVELYTKFSRRRATSWLEAVELKALEFKLTRPHLEHCTR